MAHKRKEIRELIVSLLKADISLVAVAKVFESRVEPIWGNIDLPCICVYTNRETNESFNDHARVQHRVLEVSIEAIIQGLSNIDDSLDAICLEVEQILLSEANERNEFWQSIELSQTEILYGDNGKQPIAAAKMNFNINYETIY